MSYAQFGTLVISRTNDHPFAAARVHLYGPRGGIIGSTLIAKDDAQEAMSRLRQFAGPGSESASKLDTLLDAAEAVLDSEAGIASMGELAKALHAMDPKRDYRTEFPDVAAANTVMADRFPQTATALQLAQAISGEAQIDNGMPSRITIPVGDGEEADGDFFTAAVDHTGVIVTLSTGVLILADGTEDEFDEREFTLDPETVVGIHEDA